MNGSRIQQIDSPATQVSVTAIAVPLFVLLLAALPADGEIFKCTAKKAMPTYQNFPCEYESLDALQPIAHTKPAEVASVPRVGMTASQVKAIWGEPTETVREEFVKGDIETWTYTDSRSIRFDPKGRVQEINW